MRSPFSSVVLGLLFVVSLPIAALALSKTFTWDAVSTTTDGGQAIPDSYTLYRSTDNSVTFAKVACTELTNDPKLLNRICTDSNVPNGSTSYQVTASNMKGESLPSNRVLFFLPSTPPSAPANLHPVALTPLSTKHLRK